jgi:hypothetical protein
LSSFHENSSLQDLYDGNGKTIAGPISVSLKRNRRLRKENKPLDCDPPSGPWAKAIERLGDKNTGTTAVYKIMQEKLVMWWAPKVSPPVVGAAAFAAAATDSTFNRGNAKRQQRSQEASNDHGGKEP